MGLFAAGPGVARDPRLKVASGWSSKEGDTNARAGSRLVHLQPVLSPPAFVQTVCAICVCRRCCILICSCATRGKGHWHWRVRAEKRTNKQLFFLGGGRDFLQEGIFLCSSSHVPCLRSPSLPAFSVFLCARRNLQVTYSFESVCGSSSSNQPCEDAEDFEDQINVKPWGMGFSAL